jgi:hypothetical protein
MSQQDRQRIDAWSELLRESERGLEPSLCSVDRLMLDVDSVTATSQLTDPAQIYPATTDMMIRLIALALMCDANRSIVLSFPGFVTFDWDGVHHTRDHDGLAHRTGSFTVGGTCFPGVLDMLAEIDTWYAGKFFELVELLDSIEEGESTLLDHTATLWLQEFSDGNVMNLNNMPILIAGSANGALKQGVAVNVEGGELGRGNSEDCCGPDDNDLITMTTGSTGGNVPINKLYVTLMNALGCQAPEGGPVHRFGQLDTESPESGITNPGELTELKA